MQMGLYIFYTPSLTTHKKSSYKGIPKPQKNSQAPLVYISLLIVLPRVPPWWHSLTIMKYKVRPAFSHYSESFECYNRLC